MPKLVYCWFSAKQKDQMRKSPLNKPTKYYILENREIVEVTHTTNEPEHKLFWDDMVLLGKGHFSHWGELYYKG